MQNETKKKSRGQAFFRFVMNLTESDKGRAAALRRADNPSTEYQSWEHFATFGIDLGKPYERLPYGLIAAAIVKAKLKKNGTIHLGEAIASCYDKGAQNDQAKAKLRRLLACDTVEEVCAILRPLLQLINTKSTRLLNYARLLDDLLNFYWKQQKIKESWAQNFYGWRGDEEVQHDS